MATEWTKELYDAAYVINAEPEGHPNTRSAIQLHYNRYVLYPERLRRAQQFVQILGITTADRILVVGCGFGWTVEALLGMGYNAVGTDVSRYIQDNKSLAEDTDVSSAIAAVGLNPSSGEGLVHFNRLKSAQRTSAPVLNEDSSSNPSRNRVKNFLGSDPTIAITEDLVTSLTDSECAVLQSNIVKYAANLRVVHFINEDANPLPPFNLNQKTLEEWKLIFPTATLIADGTYRVL